MMEFFPARPDRWLAMLAQGWRFHDSFAPDFTDWNGGWPVVILCREVADG